MLDCNPEDIIKAKQQIQGEEETLYTVSTVEDKEPSDFLFNEFLTWKTVKKTKTVVSQEKNLSKPYLKGNPNNVLVIGDTHELFSLEGYLEFCREKQEEYNCGEVVFIGDIVDNHFYSFHDVEQCALAW